MNMACDCRTSTTSQTPKSWRLAEVQYRVTMHTMQLMPLRRVLQANRTWH